MLTDWDGRRVFITGITGFVGRHLARYLLAHNAHVGGLAHTTFAADGLFAELSPGELREHIWVGDVGLSLRFILDRFKPEVVINCAAVGVNTPATTPELMRVNVKGVMNLLEYLSLHAPEATFVQVGSGFEYGPGSHLGEETPLQPVTAYARSKAAASQICAAYAHNGLDARVARLFTPYGPGDDFRRLIPSAIAHRMVGMPIEITGGKQQRDFIYIDDAVAGIAAVAGRDRGVREHHVYNICTGTGTSVFDAAQLVAGMGADPVPVEIEVGAVAYRDGELFENSGDPRRAHDELDWTALTPLPLGIERTMRAITITEQVVVE